MILSGLALSGAGARADTDVDFRCTLAESAKKAVVDTKVFAEGRFELHDSVVMPGKKQRFYKFTYDVITQIGTLEADDAIRVSSKMSAGAAIWISHQNDYEPANNARIECRRGGGSEAKPLKKVSCFAVQVKASAQIGAEPVSTKHDPRTVTVREFQPGDEPWQYLGELKFGDRIYTLSDTKPNDFAIRLGSDTDHVSYSAGAMVAPGSGEMRIREILTGGNYSDLVCGAD